MLELVPVDKVENEIMEADVNLSKIIDIQEQIADFKAKSRVSDKSEKLPSELAVDKSSKESCASKDCELVF